MWPDMVVIFSGDVFNLAIWVEIVQQFVGYLEI